MLEGRMKLWLAALPWLVLAAMGCSGAALADYEDERLEREHRIWLLIEPVAAAMGELRFCGRDHEADSIGRRLVALRTLLITREVDLLAKAKPDYDQQDLLLAMVPYAAIGGAMSAIAADKASQRLELESRMIGNIRYHDKCADISRVYVEAITVIDSLGTEVYGASRWQAWAEANPINFGGSAGGEASE